MGPRDIPPFWKEKPHRRYVTFRKWLQSLYPASIVARNFYEMVLQDLIATLVKPGDTVIDVGANAGKHTIKFLQALRGQGVCLAFEPNPEMCEILLKRTEAIDTMTGPLLLLRFAASDATGEDVFHVVPDKPALSRMSPTADFSAAHQTREIKIAKKMLDDIDVSGRVAFIKIDVEGHELSVLRGGQRMISDHRPFIFFECNFTNLRQNGAHTEMFSFFQSREYSVFGAFGEQAALDTIDVPKPTNFFAIPSEKTLLGVERLHFAILYAMMELLADRQDS